MTLSEKEVVAAGDKSGAGRECGSGGGLPVNTVVRLVLTEKMPSGQRLGGERADLVIFRDQSPAEPRVHVGS